MASAVGAVAGIIITLIIIGLIWWGIQQLLPLIPLPEPFARIVYVLLVILLAMIALWAIVVLLGVAGLRVPSPFSRGTLPGPTTASAATGYLQGMLGG